MMGLVGRAVSRVLKPILKATEGAVRPGPWQLPMSGGWLPADVGNSWNWWQRGFDIERGDRSAMVEACISSYSQTVAMLPLDHWWLNDDNGRERQETSALSRISRQGPNAYQTLSDFLLNAVDDLYSDGNAYALAFRNSRNEIEELHLMNPRMCMGRIAITGEVFYNLGGNYVVDYQTEFPLIVPSRDVLHLKLRTSPFNILLGESPILSTAREMASGNAVMQQQINFYLNQARPSFILTTDQTLDATQAQTLRDRWDEMSRGLNVGKTPILSSGIKAQPLGQNANDSQLAEIMKMSDQRIALAFRVPLQILGIGGTTSSSAEDLMSVWLAGGLNFCLNHVETATDALFGLKGYPQEYSEFDTSALLRSAMKDRIEAFARGVQGGIFSPNEARADFGMKKVPFGDEPRVQAQNVPLSAAQGIPSAPSAPAAPAVQPVPAKDYPDDKRATKWARDYISRANKADRRRRSA